MKICKVENESRVYNGYEKRYRKDQVKISELSKDRRNRIQNG